MSAYNAYGYKRTTRSIMMPLHASRVHLDLRTLSSEAAGVYFHLLLIAWERGNPIGYARDDLLRVLGVSEVEPILKSLSRQGYINRDDDEIFLTKLDDYASVPGRYPLDAKIKAYVMERDGGKCQYCGTTDRPLTIDHIIPLFAGAKTIPTISALHASHATSPRATSF